MSTRPKDLDLVLEAATEFSIALMRGNRASGLPGAIERLRNGDAFVFADPLLAHVASVIPFDEHSKISVGRDTRWSVPAVGADAFIDTLGIDYTCNGRGVLAIGITARFGPVDGKRAEHRWLVRGESLGHSWTMLQAGKYHERSSTVQDAAPSLT